MRDEFEYPRLRVETHPSMAEYLASRTDKQLAALIYDETYRRNVFGTYPGLSGDHSMAIIAEARRRERERCAPVVAEEEALATFTEYFVKNYPGPDTIIYKPEWHAPKIFRAAKHALLNALSVRAEPVAVKPLAELEARAAQLRLRIQELRIDHPEVAERRRDELEAVEADIAAHRSAMVASPAPDDATGRT